ncbi:MAG TPA: hypothetical protein VFQ68_26770 [Streptosporangiaceae bacterium]|nr:hypothetical protein [Streptosporangiaceae bacterium]
MQCLIGEFRAGTPGTTSLIQSLLDSLPDAPSPPVLVIDDAHLLTHPDATTTGAPGRTDQIQ